MGPQGHELSSAQLGMHVGMEKVKGIQGLG